MQIVKRKGHKQEFDERKLYASIFAACTVLRLNDQQAELIAATVTKKVKENLDNSKEVSSLQIHREVVKELRIINPDAALIFDTHKDLS